MCPSVRRSVRPSVRPSVRWSVGHTRVEFLRNGPNSNKIASGIRKYAIWKTIERQVRGQLARTDLLSELCSTCSAENAFKGKNGQAWASRGTDPTPMIWFQFEEAHSLAKIGFSSRESKDKFGRTPAHFLVIGSTMTENCNKWSTLLEVKNAGFTEQGEFKEWLIPAVNRKPFHCIGFKIVSTIDKENIAALKNITMWD